MTPATRSARGPMLLAGAGSAVILGGALASQYIGGLVPCHLCILERWPHMAAIVIAALGLSLLARFRRALAALGLAAMLASTGLGVYHTGVERGWWAGPSSCTSSTNVGAVSADQLMSQIMKAPLVRCDQVQWSFLTLSLASWNAIASVILAGLWLAALGRRVERRAAPQDSSSASQ